MRFSPLLPLILLFIFLVSGNCYSLEWYSPVEDKYKNAYPDLYVKYDEARSLIDEYSGNQDVLVKAKVILDEVLQSMDGFAPAYKEYARLIRNAGFIRLRMYEEGTLETSELLLNKAILLEPDYADAFVYLGYLYIQTKEYDKSEKALIKAENIGTDNPWLDANWARLLWYQGKNDEALAKYKAIVDSKPKNEGILSVAYNGMQQHYIDLKEYDKAKLWYQKEVDLAPNNAWTNGNYGAFLLYYLADIEGAIEHLTKALQIMDYGVARRDYTNALYAKWAKLFMENGETLETKNAREEAVSQSDKDTHAANKLAGYEATRDLARTIDQYHLDKLRDKLEKDGVIQIQPEYFKVNY